MDHTERLHVIQMAGEKIGSLFQARTEESQSGK